MRPNYYGKITMWQKGSRFVLKLLCLWFFLGAYSYWKLSDKRESFKETRVETDRTFSHYEKNDFHDLEGENEKHLLHYPDLGAFSFLKGSSRQLLAVVLPNCTPRAVEQFPWDGLTEEQREKGLLILHVMLALYMFMALAIVCDRYFVPSLEVLCELLNLQTDVAGATFMAAGSSAPELATAVIGVFIAKADVGLGTVVGSAIYNVMFVISMCALLATSVIHLHWWPMVRDCIAYFLSVLALILIINDAKIQWYETLILLAMYILYVGFMFFNKRLEAWCVPRLQELTCCLGSKESKESKGVSGDTMVSYDTFSDLKAVNGATPESKGKENGLSEDKIQMLETSEIVDHAHQEAETWHKLCERPEGVVWTVLWAVSMPLSVVLFVTVPDCRRPSLRRLFWLTFLLSLLWLSVFCFLMVWMITVVGYTLDIPDSVMSLTFIAFGVSLPDVVSSVLVVRDGLGDMAISNAIGSNVFDILVCLGLPWFLQTCVKDPGSSIPVYSEGLLYSSIMLLSTVLFLLLVTQLSGWQLTKTYGVILLVVYVLYTVLASLYELNVFGYFHPPECPSSY